jgi:hypothetical protein
VRLVTAFIVEVVLGRIRLVRQISFSHVWVWIVELRQEQLGDARGGPSQ